jgi:hypothetical protein
MMIDKYALGMVCPGVFFSRFFFFYTRMVAGLIDLSSFFGPIS